MPYRLLVFILWKNGFVKLQNREEERERRGLKKNDRQNAKYILFRWKWKLCARFFFYKVLHYGCPAPLYNRMNGKQQFCFYLKKNFERSLRFTCIPPPARKCKFPSSAHDEARFRTTVQCAFKPSLFHSRKGEEGRRENDDQQSKPKIAWRNNPFPQNKKLTENKLFRRFPYLPYHQWSQQLSRLPQQGRAQSGTDFDPTKSHTFISLIGTGRKHVPVLCASSACLAKVYFITSFNNTEKLQSLDIQLWK